MMLFDQKSTLPYWGADSNLQCQVSAESGAKKRKLIGQA